MYYIIKIKDVKEKGKNMIMVIKIIVIIFLIYLL